MPFIMMLPTASAFVASFALQSAPPTLALRSGLKALSVSPVRTLGRRANPIEWVDSRVNPLNPVVRHNVSCTLSQGDDDQLPSRPPNFIPLVVYVLYIGRLFIFPPFATDTTGEVLPEALKLSFDFAYINTVLLPNALTAPILPQIEAIFHIVVVWTALLTGFSSLEVTAPKTKPRPIPFLIAALLLTNIFYLPYLILRHTPSDPDPIPAPEPQRQKPSPRLIKFLEFTESKRIPIFCLTLFSISVPWAFLGPGTQAVGVHERIAEFVDRTLNHDILSYSFVVDCFVYSFFQSSLVQQDASSSLRQWSSLKIRKRATTASYIPFFGLVFYLIQRAEHGPLDWTSVCEEKNNMQ